MQLSFQSFRHLLFISFVTRTSVFINNHQFNAKCIQSRISIRLATVAHESTDKSRVRIQHRNICRYKTVDTHVFIDNLQRDFMIRSEFQLAAFIFNLTNTDCFLLMAQRGHTEKAMNKNESKKKKKFRFDISIMSIYVINYMNH